MRKQRLILWWAAASAGLLWAQSLRGQDAALGSFTDLVNDAQETIAQQAATPPPETPMEPRMVSTGGKQVQAVATSEEPKIFSARKPSLLFEYRFKQDKTGAMFGVNAFEMRPGFGITIAKSTVMKLEYVHAWFDGDNDLGATRSADENGVKLLMTIRTIPDVVEFSFPFSYAQRNTDTNDATGLTKTTTGSFATNPFVALSRSVDVHEHPLKLLLIPGVRFGVSDRDYTNTPTSNVRMWQAQTNLQVRAEYGAVRTTDKVTLLTLIASATWSHVVGYYSSDNSPLIADNSFGLSGGARFQPIIGVDANQKPAQSLSLSINYQYDGFNRESYQHAVNFAATYTF